MATQPQRPKQDNRLLAAFLGQMLGPTTEHPFLSGPTSPIDIPFSQAAEGGFTPEIKGRLRELLMLELFKAFGVPGIKFQQIDEGSGIIDDASELLDRQHRRPKQ